MATIEELHFAQQAVQNVQNMARDCRMNAADHRRKLADPEFPNAKIVQIAAANLRQYRKRLKWMDDIHADPEKAAMLHRGLAALGIDDPDEIHALVEQLKAACDELEGASEADLITRCERMCEMAPSFVSVWPER